MKLTERVMADFMERDDEGYPDLQLPDDLPYDDAKCVLCRASIGACEYEGEDGYGRPVGGIGWQGTWETEHGTFVCEDCANEIDNEEGKA